MPENTTAARAVFLSYAREDAEPVRRIADALRAFGVEVWFDQNELRGGDAWDTKIRTQIRTCTLCVPVISATTQARGEGYFRREWRFAVERTHDMAANVPFLLPVVIDDTQESEALVPDEFMKVQWTRLPKGVPTSQFVEQVKKLLEGKVAPVSDRRAGSIPSIDTGQRPALPQKGVPGWTWGVGAAVLVTVVAAVLLMRKAERAAEPLSVPASEAKLETPAAPAPRLSDKSIAVIPFTNMSEEKDSAFFTDGMHEDILTNLALVRELRVVSRTSVMSYRGTTKPMKQIAQELGVTYILEGSVRRSGNKVRVTGQLIHAASDEHVWAASYDRDLTDVFTIQAELSRQIAGALKAALSPEEKVLIARKPTENPAAYDLYLQARDFGNRLYNSQEVVGQRIKRLEEAVALDPIFGRAWGELGSLYALSYFWGFNGTAEGLARAKTAIDRGVALAPDDPDVIASLGTYYYYALRDYARATEQYERLARLQPNSPVLFNSLGLIYRRQGRWPEALARMTRATELDPSNLAYLRNLASSQWNTNRWDDAIASQQRISALSPNDMWEKEGVAEFIWLKSGSRREADAYFAGLTPAQRDSVEGIALAKSWALTAGDHAEFVRLDKVQPYYETDGEPHWWQASSAALPYLALGDRPAAIARLGEFPAEVRAQLTREPTNKRLWLALARMEVVLGHKDEALRCAERMVELVPEATDAMDGPQYAGHRAKIYDLTGEKEKALAEYSRLLRKPGSLVVKVQLLKGGYSTLRGDPRFEALLNDPANNAPLF